MFEKYARQTVFDQVGLRGQKRLSKSVVCQLGCGGLGSLLSQSLMRAGVGELRIVDSDHVDLSNLQRQFLSNETDVKKKKVSVAVDKLKRINSKVAIKGFEEKLNPRNYKKIMKGVDLIIDATDSMKARFLINEVSVKQQIPWIYTSCIQDRGTVAFFTSKKPCFKCVFEPDSDDSKNCSELGILNQAVMISAAIASKEALFYLIKKKSFLKNKLLHYSLADYSFNLVRIKAEDNCSCCVKKKFDRI